jgi:hypothetical protein
MKNRLLVSTAMLLAGLAYASAQTPPAGNQSEGAGAAPKREAPAKAPQRGQERGGVTAGQADRQGGPAAQAPQRSQEPRAQSAGQGKREGGSAAQSQTTGQGKREGGQATQQQRGKQEQQTSGQGKRDGGQADQRRGKQEQTTGQGKRDGGQATQQRRGQQEQTTGQSPAQQQNRQNQADQTGQQGAQGTQQGQAQPGQAQQGQAQQGQAQQGRVMLSSEQRTRVRQQIFARADVPRVTNVNFAVRVGTIVPTRVRLVAVPDVLITIHPQYRGHRYFVVRDEICIVDDRHRIVAIIPLDDQTAGYSGPARGSGGAAIAVEWTPAQIRQVQLVLIQKGFDIEADGIFGPNTRQALISFQQRQGLEVTGRIDNRTVVALGVNFEGGGAAGMTTGSGSNAQQPSASPGSGQPGQSGSAPTAGQGGMSSQQSPGASRSSGQGAGNNPAGSPDTSGQGSSPNPSASPGTTMSPSPGVNDGQRPMMNPPAGGQNQMRR